MNKFDVSSLTNVPHKPGCYLWKNEKNEVIYIGKAKDLNKRMHQYFNKSQSNRIYKLTNQITGFDYIVVDDENEALVLENNLIKTHKPKFNILLKEGGDGYPYIVLTNDKHPKLLYTRKYNPKKGKYFGPFASNETNAYELFNYLNRIIPLRKCNIIPRQKCMYYDLGQCLGPCINKIKKEQYEILIKKVDDIFNNKNNKKILNELKQKEIEASNNLEFETAQYYLKLQNSFESIVHKQTVQLKKNINIDYVGYFCNEHDICINIFNFLDGKLVTKHANIVEYYVDVKESILSYLMQYYNINKVPKEIYIALDDNDILNLSTALNTKIVKPIKGPNLELLTQSITNAQYFYNKNKLIYDKKNKLAFNACNELTKLLNINSANHIEMIDNSNIFLETPVSAVVVFINGMPEKKLYRRYNLEYMEQKSDFHFMKEVINRRFSKMIANNYELPNIFIVDGGKIQLNAAYEVLKNLKLEDKVCLIGLEKDNHHKTKNIVTINETITLEKNSDLYLFLSTIQDEVHRFVISYFQNKSLKSKLSTFLDDIDGLGNKTKDKILRIYPNLADIKNVTIETLEQIMPKKVALKLKQKVMEVFNNE